MRLIVRTPPDAPVASLFEFSRRYCGAPIDHAVADIVPLVKHDQLTKLELRRGQAFLRLHGVHYSSAGDVVAYSAIDVDDGYIRFEIFRRR